MSHLEFKAYAPVGQNKRDRFGYCQSVKVENTVYISGQGGWYPTIPDAFPPTQPEQIDVAFENIALALADVEANFEHVFKVVSYHRPLDKESLGRVVECFAKYMPNHKPLWTCVQTEMLGEEQMLVEIEVVAHVPGPAVI